jgi:hypothetical protein
MACRNGSASTSAPTSNGTPIRRTAPTSLADPLLRTLRDRGAVTEEVLTGADGVRSPLGRLAVRDHHVIDAAGQPHPRRFALGAWVGRGFGTSGFTRPRTNAAPLRTGDALARAVLRAVLRAVMPAEER